MEQEKKKKRKIYHPANLHALNIVLNEVNNAYLALSNSAAESTSHSLTIFPTSYSSAYIGDSERMNAFQLPLPQTPPHIYFHHVSNYLCHLATTSCSFSCFAVAMCRIYDPGFLFVYQKKLPQQFTLISCGKRSI